jgi:hypothetical protein
MRRASVAASSPDATKLPERLDRLSGLSAGDLRHEWRQHFRADPPASMSRELLLRAIGFRMQEAVIGGLSRRTELRLGSLGSVAGRGKASPPDRPALKSGTKLLREWQGKVHEVLTLDDGRFAYGGHSYRSLSTIARAITGAHWSGPRFFGIKEAAHG